MGKGICKMMSKVDNMIRFGQDTPFEKMGGFLV